MTLTAGGQERVPPQLTTADGRIVDQRGNPVRMRGFNVLPVWTDRPGATWPAAEYRKIRRAGFNTVRFMLHWDAMEPARGRLDRRHLRTLDVAIARAARARLRVVLNVIGVYKGESSFPAWARTGDALGSLEEHGPGVVRRLAARYAQDPAVVALDPVNEPPSYPPEQDRILRMYRLMFDAVRKVAPRKLLMFEPSFGNSSMVGADLGILGDKPGLVFSPHYYYAGGAGPGYAQTGEVLPAAAGARNAAFGDGYDGADPTELEAHVRVNLDVMRRAGIPVWVGEFGMELGAPNAKRWIRDMVTLLDRDGTGHAWWLYDHRSGSTPLRSDGRFRPFVRLLAGRD